MGRSPHEPASPARFLAWRAASLHALPVVGLLLALFYYWFALRDRYIVFLYNHDMGPLYPDTSPFSRVTASRYWMAGLVAGGLIMLLYAAAARMLGRFLRNYRLPERRRVWAVCAAVSLLGIPAITLTANQPTLPLGETARVTLVAVIALGFALWSGGLATKRPGELAWLSADGFGLMLLMLNLIHVEKLRRWLDRGGTMWVTMMVLSLVLGVGWLLVVTGLGIWRRRRPPGAGVILLAGGCQAYLLMPLVHHLIGTDGYFYITDSDNFFAKSTAVQLLAWLVTAGLALGLTWLRKKKAPDASAAHWNVG